ncbi:MAG: hypothetical protein C0501_02710 [Isosphaera sp.]|nr:hypothetical protein [Isosphaera sp.]
MADPTPSPALPSTADADPYVPVSWMAVAASIVAGAFAAALAVLMASAFLSKKPLLVDELFVFPVLGVVLAFAARRMIRNSEGTRTGENLANAAWWVCLVGGLGYAAYLLGVSYSVRRDAAGEAERWARYVADPDGDEGKNLNRAFLRTREPGRRGDFNPADAARLRAEFRDEYVVFLQTDLARLARRNGGGALRFAPGGITGWTDKPGMVECSYAGTFECPEGTFPVEIPLRGLERTARAEGAAGREWMVGLTPNGYVAREKVTLTPYGWRVFELEQLGGAVGREFVQRSGGGVGARAYLYQTLVNPEPLPPAAAQGASLLLAVLRPLTRLDPTVLLFTPDYPAHMQNEFVRLPGGGDPPTDKKAQFARQWSEFGLFLPGRRLQGNDKIDAGDLLSVTDAAVEVRVACEVPVPAAGGGSGAARGRLVVRCADPAVVSELKALRDQAKPGEGTATPPDEFGKKQVPWRVVRVESDLHEVRVERPGPGGPGG